MLPLPRQIRKHLAGPRILKTGISIFICEMLFLVIGQERYAAFAATSAIVAVLPSLAGSRNQLKKSMTANLLAGAVALVVGLLWGQTPLALTLSAVLVLYVLVKLNMSEQAGVVSVTLIWMLSRESNSIGPYIIGRVGAITVGTLIGYLVNRYILPPNFLPRIRDGLSAAAQSTAVFGERVAASLTDPESLSKAEIKAMINQIRNDLTLCGQKILWQVEAGTPEAVYLPLEKTKAALFVYVVELARVHKTALTMGGFPPGPVADHVTKTVRVACLNMLGVCQPLTRGEAPDAHSRNTYLQAMEELQQLVERLIDDRATRELGLACHRVHTSIRHMGRRMRICREVVARAAEERPTGQGKPVF
ncbi:MAG TPA: aromatic acid exporter family protein [Symbiobacteriaceae bacterium]|nr:aromatic acid exporter family protein [Symbiobacteriaceae bacterium]